MICGYYIHRHVGGEKIAYTLRIQVIKLHSNDTLPLNWQQHSTLQLLLTHVVYAVQAIVRFSSLQETDVITFSSLVSILFLFSANTFLQGNTISCVSLLIDDCNCTLVIHK